MEIDNYGRLNFLGTTIIIENQRIISLINIKRQHFPADFLILIHTTHFAIS